MIFVSPMGANVFNFSVGAYQMSLFRMAAILATFLAVIIKNKKLTVIPGGENKISVIAYLSWWFMAIISVAWAMDLGSWIKSVFFVSIGAIVIILFIHHFNGREDIIKALTALQFGILVQSFIGWYEIFTRDYQYILYKNAVYFSESVYRIPIAMQENPNDFATLMLVGFGISLSIAAYRKKKKAKLLNFIIAVNFAVLLVMTTSRANILGLLLFIATVFLLSKKGKLIIIPLVCILPLIIPQILAFLEDVLQFDFSNTDGSDGIRLNLIRNGFVFLGDTFGFGTGAGQIEYWMENRAVYYTSDITNMHNYWMEILTGYGVFIFVFYIIFYCKMFLSFLKWYSSKNVDDSYRKPALYICAFMVGYVIGCVSSSSMISSEWNWVFWGILISYQGVLDNERTLLLE